MKCHGCGHEFVKTLTRCPRCHRSTSNATAKSTTKSIPRRGRTSNDSRLLEFPRKTRFAPPVEAPASIPAWRAELNERVRAIRARRNTEPQSTTEQLVNSADPDFEAALTAQQPELEISYSANTASGKATPRRSSIEQPEIPMAPARRTSSNIVEAALIRVKRASENASRAALPKIEPPRTMSAGSQVGLALDRGATARALEPAPEIEATPEPAPSPRPELLEPQIHATPLVDPVLPKATSVKRVVAAPAEPLTTPVVDLEINTLLLDEIEPVDYLEAEIRKVDQTLGTAFLRNESPAIFTHAVILAVDLIAIAASCAPFLAIIRITDGNFTSAPTRISAIAIVIVISFFYLVLTQGLCCRTFGMMLTNTRVVDARTFEAPPATRALLRTVGYFIAAAPAMLGIVWAAFNRRRRGWQDFLSGTVVVRDF